MRYAFSRCEYVSRRYVAMAQPGLLNSVRGCEVSWKEKTYRYIILAFPRLEFWKKKRKQSVKPQADSLTRSAFPLHITTVTLPRPQLNTYVSKVLDTFALQNHSGCLISDPWVVREVDEEHKSHHILMSTYYSRLPHTGKK
jgi:hypothetical protein